jgi:hypothetical protein
MVWSCNPSSSRQPRGAMRTYTLALWALFLFWPLTALFLVMRCRQWNLPRNTARCWCRWCSADGGSCRWRIAASSRHSPSHARQAIHMLDPLLSMWKHTEMPLTPLHTASPRSLKGAALPDSFSSPDQTAPDPPPFPPCLSSNPSAGESSALSKSELPSPFVPHHGEVHPCLFSLRLVVDLLLPCAPSCYKSPPPPTRTAGEAPPHRNQGRRHHLPTLHGEIHPHSTFLWLETSPLPLSCPRCPRTQSPSLRCTWAPPPHRNEAPPSHCPTSLVSSYPRGIAQCHPASSLVPSVKMEQSSDCRIAGSERAS